MHKASPRRVKTEGIDETLPRSSIDSLNLGDRVEIRGELGIVRFIGATTFAPGKWIGVELDSPTGRNDGNIQGQRYFECRFNHGVFVRPSQVKHLSNSSPSAPDAIHSVENTNEMMNDSSHSSQYASKPETHSFENSSMPKTQSRLVKENGTENHRESLEEDDYLRHQIDELSRNRERLQGLLRESSEKLRLKDEELDEQLLLSQHLEIRCREFEAQMTRWDLEQRESTARETMLRVQNEKLAKRLDHLTSSLNEVSERTSPPSLDGSAIAMSIDHSISATSSMMLPERQLDEGVSELQSMWDEERTILERRIKNLDEELDLLRNIRLEKEKLQLKLRQMQRIMEELKERAEAADSAEEMIEKLSSRKSFLENRVRELEENIQELEELRDINRELDETHVETERQMQNEIIRCEEQLGALVIELNAEKKVRRALESRLDALQNQIHQMQMTSDNDGKMPLDSNKPKLQSNREERPSIFQSSPIPSDYEENAINLGVLLYKVNCLIRLAGQVTDAKFCQLLDGRCVIEKTQRICLTISKLVVSFVHLADNHRHNIACFNVGKKRTIRWNCILISSLKSLILMADLNGLLTLMGLSFDINDESFLNLFFGHLEGFGYLSASLSRTLNELQSRGFSETTSLLEVERFLDQWALLKEPRSYMEGYSGHLGIVVSKLIGIFHEQLKIFELINNEFSETKVDCEFVAKLYDCLL